MGEKFDAGLAPHAPAADRCEEAWLHANLGRVPLPVTALLETTHAGARAARAETG